MEKIGPKSPLRWYLREWRKKKGLSQEQLANRLDTNKGQISKLERGDQRMNDDWIAGLANALDIEPGDLLRDPEAPTLNDLLRSASPEQMQEIRAIAQIMLRRKAS